MSVATLGSVKTQPSKNRNYNLEILRIIAAFGIVLYHGAAHGEDGILVREIGFSSIVVFVLISSYLLAHQNNYSLFVSKKAGRLLIPWLFWFFVYGFVRLINGQPFFIETNDIFSAVLAGTKYHLWYLPFMFIVSIIIVFYYDLVEHYSFLNKYNFAIFMLLSMTLLIISPLWRPWSLSLVYPWVQWCFMFPAIFIGATFYNLNYRLSDHRIIILYVAVIALTSIWLIFSGLRSVGLSYIIGFLLFVAAIYLKSDLTRCSKIIMTVSNCTYGIYLIHPLIYSIENKIGFSENIFMPFLTYALSLLIIVLANKIPVPFIKKII